MSEGRIHFNVILAFMMAGLLLGCGSPEERIADVVVIGGGASGVAAAIQAARMEVDVILVEETDWLGGMLTAAGVSATDGNHKMPSGFWGEFRQALYDHYGGPAAVATGWVSHTLFEPHVGNKLLHDIVAREPRITVLKGYRLDGAEVSEGSLRSVTVRDANGGRLRLSAGVFIEATEYGDVIAAAGVPYARTMETFKQTREASAPVDPHPYVQDLTYVAILKDYRDGADHTIPEPEGYDTADFECMCREVCDAPAEGLITCQSMLDYGKLPGGKYMINWPNKGNDTYLEILEKTPEERTEELRKAKTMTLSWIRFLQTKGGFIHLGLADDEFPTQDRLAMIPYIRESRRVEGVDRFYLYDIQDPFALPRRPIYKTAIATGDYPVDHHRKKNPVPVQIEFPRIPSYSVPYGSLIPRTLDGLIVAEKSISVSNVVNGTTRLQPVVLQIGQAAGAAAALSVHNGIEPRAIDVRELQQSLLDAGMWLMPYMDTTPDDWAFQSIQRVGLAGLMRGEGIPVAWANETRFHPDLAVDNFGEIAGRLAELAGMEAVEVTQVEGLRLADSPSRGQALESLGMLRAVLRPDLVEPMNLGSSAELELFRNAVAASGTEASDIATGMKAPITRRELAFLLDRLFDPLRWDQVRIGFPNPMLD